MRAFRFTSFAICVAAMALGARPAAALSFTSVTPSASQVPRYEILEIDATLDADFDNPYDPAQIDVYATVQIPYGPEQRVDAFWFEPYDRSLDGDLEVFTPTGPGRWRVRYAPRAPAEHVVRLFAAAGAETAESDPLVFWAEVESSPGFVRVDADNPRYFAFDGGDIYAPLGFDICWVNDYSGAYAYTAYLDKLAAGGGNWTRLWLSHFSQGTILEWGAYHPTGFYAGLGRYSQQIGAKLDAIFGHAQDLGVAIEVALHQHSQFETAQWSSWADNPYNAANGGPCETSADYFTNEEALRLADNLHRYLVARYAAYRSVMSWELFNEADGILGVPPSLINGWMHDRADDLRARDPADHLISTSYASPVVLPYLELEGYDFNNRHQYTFGSWLIGAQLGRYHDAARPVLLAEYGLDWEGALNQFDPLGVGSHNAIWNALMAGYAGGAMTWWWDNYIDPQDLWGLNLAPAAFLAAENLRAYAENVEFALGAGDWRYQAIGLTSALDQSRRALGWVRNRQSDWWSGANEPTATTGLQATVAFEATPASRACRVEYWDSWAGTPIGEDSWLAPGGPVTLTLPDFTRDIAFKLSCDEASPPDDDDDNDDNNDDNDDNDDHDADEHVDDDDHAEQGGDGDDDSASGCGC